MIDLVEHGCSALLVNLGASLIMYSTQVEAQELSEQFGHAQERGNGLTSALALDFPCGIGLLVVVSEWLMCLSAPALLAYGAAFQ